MYRQVSYVLSEPPVEFREGVEEGVGCPLYYCRLSPAYYNIETDREEATLQVLEEGKSPRYYLVFRGIGDSLWLWGNHEIIPQKIPKTRRKAKTKEKKTGRNKKE